MKYGMFISKVQTQFNVYIHCVMDASTTDLQLKLFTVCCEYLSVVLVFETCCQLSLIACSKYCFYHILPKIKAIYM
jgi:hypothetical protein